MGTLETDRLTLRMLRESDLDAYAENAPTPRSCATSATASRRPGPWRGVTWR